MSYIGDINLDAEGNTVISGGEMVVTESNLDFIVRSMKYARGSFRRSPAVGFGIDRYLGKRNNDATHRQMKRELTDYFNQYGLPVEINIIPTSKDSIAGELISSLDNLRVIFVFNMASGVLIIEDDKQSEPVADIEAPGVSNKYLNRR